MSARAAKLVSIGVAAIGVLSIGVAALGCSRDDDAKQAHIHDITLGQRAAPAPTTADPALPVKNAGSGYSMAQLFDAEARANAASPSDTDPRAGSTGTPAATTPTATASAVPSAAPAAPKVNPDDAVLERTRVACGACFASLPAGPGYGPPTRSAHVSLTVIPTGSVSRANATSNDTNDPDVLECIQSTAQAAMFSDNNGGPLRTYAIDVRVSAPGANGGH